MTNLVSPLKNVPIEYRVSQCCAYTNWGFLYTFLGSFCDDYFQKPKTLAHILAKTLRWKRTYFHGERTYLINGEPRYWRQGETVLLYNNQHIPWSKV